MIESTAARAWKPPDRSWGSAAGRWLLGLASRLPAGPRTWIESLVLKVSILRGRLLVPREDLEEKFREALELLLESATPLGDYLEFGVYNGTSMSCMDRAARAKNVRSMRLIGFDSFQGLGAEARRDDGGVWRPGQFCCPRRVTEWFLGREGVDLARVELVEGWFRDSLNDSTARNLELQKASVVMIDCDCYSAAKQALQFASAFVRDRCIVFFDDWYTFDLDEKGMGEKCAFEELLAERPHLVAEPLGSYNAFSQVFLLRVSGSDGPGSGG